MILRHLIDQEVSNQLIIEFTPENPLEIDFDYYKSVIVEPLGRLLHHINSNLYDQLVEILDISKRRRKDLKKSMDEEID